MSEDIPVERYQLLAEIAEMYYLQGMSQQEIADQVDLSRPSISRLLLEAREQDIVEIKVNHPIPTVQSLEAELVKRFPLRAARVLERKTLTDEETLRQVGALGATVLNGEIEDGMILGLSWGTTVHTVVEALRPKRLPHVRVVQLVGGVGAPYRTIDGPEQVRRVGEMFGAQHYYLNAPMLVDSPEIAAALREDHSIKEVLDLAAQSDVALVGIGSIEPEISTQFHSGYLTYEDLRKLDQLGVSGAMCISFFNIEGEHIYADWCEDCAISIMWEDLKNIDTVIGVTTSKRKAPAILGAIRSQVVDILVTDDLTVEAILELCDTDAANINSG